MGSEVMTKIPIIDFGKLEMKPGSQEWNSLRDEVYQALEEYGCFEAILDGTSTPKESLYVKIKQVFNFCLKTKFGNSEKSAYGYSWNPMMPLYERLSIHHVLNPGVIENFSKILWPDGQPEFCDLVHSYAKILSELDEMVRKMIFEKLGLKSYWDDHKNSTSSALGFFKYRMPKEEDTQVGLPAHTDKLMTSILSQHQIGVSGLQVMKKNGQWLDVEYSSPHSFIFLVSDCLTALTNGRLPCPYHRVNMGDKERYSIGFSTISKEGCIIKVPEELVDEDHPLLYKPFEAVKYLEFCLLANSKGVAPTLESFCGV
ncbi:hypothetical protein RND71_015932 [Anisodus tanguticus]|uniref:Isopenicillin N synthase-like Fe(2+) 2OG dioxygenase domain-containing protein n=1 Tax=Anisodus tanguticus TaxID=243964 RepID=A0AAE1S573_9SOLA|nr:hypothetical protein RND71_015932 [Anisodus tanguticus]